MKFLFIISFVANIVLAFAAWKICPQKMAIHFGSGGTPNGWSPSYVYVIIMSVTNLLLFASFYFTPLLVRITPVSMLSLPNKKYWTQEQHRPRMMSLLEGLMFRYGFMTMVLMFTIGLLVIQANLSDPVCLMENRFLWIMGIFGAYTIYWIIALILAFRIPGDDHQQVSTDPDDKSSNECHSSIPIDQKDDGASPPDG